MRTARLQYFKRSGKFYESGSIQLTDTEAPFQVFDRVREMRVANKLPGITGNSHMSFIVYVDFPNDEFGYPALIL